MYVAAIPSFMSDHHDYAATFAEPIAALEKAQAANAEASLALADAREAEKQATADRIAGKKTAPNADQMAAAVAAAEAKSRGLHGVYMTAHTALSKAVHGNHAFTATAALDYICNASDKIAAVLPVIEEFFGGVGGGSGNFDHAAQLVQLPPSRHAIGSRGGDPGQRQDAVAVLRAAITSIQERVAQVADAKPPKPVHIVQPHDDRTLLGYR